MSNNYFRQSSNSHFSQKNLLQPNQNNLIQSGEHSQSGFVENSDAQGNINLNAPNHSFSSNTSRRLFDDRVNSSTKEKQQISELVQNNTLNLNADEREIQQMILDQMIHVFNDDIAKFGFTKEIQTEVKNTVSDILNGNNNLKLNGWILPSNIIRKLDNDYEMKMRIAKGVNSTIGLGPLEDLLADNEITEIIVQNKDSILVEKKGKIQKTSYTFESEKALTTVIDKIVQQVGRTINIANPIVDARLKDGSRVNATIIPATPDGATLTIRKFFDKALTEEDYLNYQSIDKKMLEFLKSAVRGRTNIFISGGTGTGKTTFLNMLSNSIPKDELLVSIEDTLELKIQSDNVRRMETRRGSTDEHGTSQMLELDTSMCVKNAMRMRPDRIVVGEIRDGAIVDLLSAASTGHDGTMSTGHASSPYNFCNVRLPILYSQNKDTDIKEKSQMLQFSEAFEIILQLKRFRNGGRKVTSICEIDGVDKEGRVVLKEIFVYDFKKKEFVATGHIPQRVIDKCEDNDVEIDLSLFKKEDTNA